MSQKWLPSLLILLTPIITNADPCIALLGVSSPGQAAALSAKKAVAQKDSREHFVRGMGDTPVNEADHQITAEEGYRGGDIGGKYTTQSAPVFGAGAAIEKNPMIKSILAQCQAKRAAQGQAQEDAAEKNRQIAEKARQADAANGQVGFAEGYDPRVIHVNQSANQQTLSAPLR